MEISPPAQSLDQESEQVGNIERINDHVWSPTLSQSRPLPEPPPSKPRQMGEMSDLSLTNYYDTTHYYSLEPNKTRDSNIIFDDVSITELPFNKKYAAAVETKQIAQQEAQDTPRSQQTTPGKPSTQPQTMDTASSFTRSALGLPETPLTRPRTSAPSAPWLSPPLPRPLSRPPPEPPPRLLPNSEIRNKDVGWGICIGHI